MTRSAEAVVPETGSFRDPSGHVFSRHGRIYRRVNRCYAADYQHLLESGLYQRLVDDRVLVSHRDIGPEPAGRVDALTTLEPERIPFVSYPFEWSFSELKQAAVATLRIQRLAIEHGMALKDASAYNIQFRGHAPVLIDTLSFELWHEGTPWVGYRQFCQHFLGPLALMSYTDLRLGQLSRLFIDGPPLDLVGSLLPLTSRLSPSLLMHLHLHARAQKSRGDEEIAAAQPTAFKRGSMMGLIDHLESAVEKLAFGAANGPWVDYYDRTNYSAEAMAAKERTVASLIDKARPAVVWDLGANTGAFSRLAAARGAYTVAFDGDAAAVERHYVSCRSRGERNVLPLVMDLANPTGAMGWNHDERRSLIDRGPADLVLALGLIHHLRLANQVPFAMAAEFFGRLAPTLIVEFPSPADSQVRGMLSRMPALKGDYSSESFEDGFLRMFRIEQVHSLGDSERRLYFMRRRGA
jgi:hypothetical protein